jgi:hypothetical protein
VESDEPMRFIQTPGKHQVLPEVAEFNSVFFVEMYLFLFFNACALS